MPTIDSSLAVFVSFFACILAPLLCSRIIRILFSMGTQWHAGGLLLGIAQFGILLGIDLANRTMVAVHLSSVVLPDRTEV